LKNGAISQKQEPHPNHHHRPCREDPQVRDLGEVIEDFSKSTDFSTIAPLVDPKTLGEAALNSLIEALKYRRGQ